ncbi:MAG: HIRAN domain-containing protein [Thermoflexibacteraceae bacterium]|jgi:hypothetical protein
MELTALLVIVVLLAGIGYLFAGKKKVTVSPEDKMYDAYLSQFDKTKAEIKLPTIHTKITGTAYRNPDGNDRQVIITKMKVGEKLLLIPEPTNPYDKDAIQLVRVTGELVGYLEMDLALEIKSRLLRKTLVEATVSNIYRDKQNILQITAEIQRYSVREKK